MHYIVINVVGNWEVKGTRNLDLSSLIKSRQLKTKLVMVRLFSEVSLNKSIFCQSYVCIDKTSLLLLAELTWSAMRRLKKVELIVWKYDDCGEHIVVNTMY